MTNNDVSIICSPSTNWRWAKVKDVDAPAGDNMAGQRPSAQGRKPRRNRRKWQTLQVQWRGGPTSVWAVRVGEQTWRFDGFIGIEDVMAHILNEGLGWTR